MYHRANDQKEIVNMDMKKEIVDMIIILLSLNTDISKLQRNQRSI